MLDLDALFRAYLKERQDAGEILALDDELQDVYRRWLDTPSDALRGVKPGQLFARSDPDALIEAFLSYHVAGLPVPEPMLDAIGDSRACESALRDIALGCFEGASPEARLTAMELLTQSGSAYALPVLLKALEAPNDDDASDLATDLLAGRGSTVLEELLAALPHASPSTADRICGLLADMPPDERIFSCLLQRFAVEGADVGFIASLLRRYGDDRARPALEASLEQGRAKRYADFVALKDAVETFGGTVTAEPQFPDDPDFERANGKA